jgi:hypothetical protein
MSRAPKPITESHPQLALLDWFIQLLDIPQIAILSRHPITRSRLRARLALLRPDPAPRDARRIADEFGKHLATAPHDVFIMLRAWFQLEHIDPQFPWSAIARSGSIGTGIDPARLPWPLREQMRFAAGDYQPVPWAANLPPIEDHYLHLSNEKPGLVAFTASPEKGAADIQTAIKPGRYLTRFYPRLAAHEVRDIQSAIHRTTELKFAVTADAIERVYTEGPESCMSHGEDNYDSHCHPVRVYGDSDLRLAYVTDAAGTPTARALVWPEKRLHARIYGDETLLAYLLKAAGYERGELAGARIRRVAQGAHTVVMPYIDDLQSFDVVDDTWLEIGGDHSAEATSGVADTRAFSSCGYCEDKVPDDDLADVDGSAWCSSCRQDHAFRSDFSKALFPDSEAEVVVVSRSGNRNRRQHWTTAERDEHATHCAATGEWYRTDRFDFVALANGEAWVKWYFDKHGDPGALSPEDKASAGNSRQATGERAAA